MMKMGHYATASPVGLGMAWAMTVTGVASLPVAITCAALVVWSSTLNDLDHPRFKGRMHPGAALVRGTAHLGYIIRTPRDKDRVDLHRGPTHCIEWCVLAGAMFAGLLSQIPPVAGWAWWLGAAVTVGTASHILADLPTPSGVPVSAVWNYFVHGEVWCRHSLGWFTTDSAGEKFLAVPLLFALSGIMFLGMIGLLTPVWVLLTGLAG